MSFIKNIDTLAATKLRKDFLSALEAGIARVHPERILRERIALGGDTLMVMGETLDLKQFKRIFVAAIGKVSSSTCKVLEDVLGNRITAGLCIDTKLEERLKIISQTVGTHPLPSKENAYFSSGIVSMIERATVDDLIILVVSGGGSALFCYPYDTECEQGEPLFWELTKKGATIQEINVVRKHLSLIKGGGLAKLAHPATVLSLIFSDVPGNDPSIIASGPTVRDTSTVRDAQAVLAKYGVAFTGMFTETPKEEEYFKKVRNVLVCTNEDALVKTQELLRSKGYDVQIHATDLQMEARETAKFLLSKAASGQVLLAGGEMSVKVKGKGKGGRNTEMTLAALPERQEGEVVISCASDGIDNTDAAGAIADDETAKKMREQKLDPVSYLENNDSYHFFEKTGDLIKTGYTGVNVSDLMLVYKPPIAI